MVQNREDRKLFWERGWKQDCVRLKPESPKCETRINISSVRMATNHYEHENLTWYSPVLCYSHQQLLQMYMPLNLFLNLPLTHTLTVTVNVASLWNMLDAGLYYSASLIASCPSTPCWYSWGRMDKGLFANAQNWCRSGREGVGGNKIHSAWPALLSLIYFCGYT